MKEMTKVEEHLWTASWALEEAIKRNDYGRFLDVAHDHVSEAKAQAILGIPFQNNEPEPDRPNEQMGVPRYTIPTIIRVPGVKFKIRGEFRTESGMAKGCVAHYTVSGRTAQNAKNVLSYLASKGLGCPVMDEHGIIYIPEDYDFAHDVVYHAGNSQWQGKNGISSYCIGMEICCWGRRPDGSFEPYTVAQEESLLNFCLWQLDVNPEFDIEWIVGHDEISPGRKTDPGRSLSCTMPEFREKLKKLA